MIHAPRQSAADHSLPRLVVGAPPLTGCSLASHGPREAATEAQRPPGREDLGPSLERRSRPGT